MHPTLTGAPGDRGIRPRSNGLFDDGIDVSRLFAAAYIDDAALHTVILKRNDPGGAQQGGFFGNNAVIASDCEEVRRHDRDGKWFGRVSNSAERLGKREQGVESQIDCVGGIRIMSP